MTSDSADYAERGRVTRSAGDWIDEVLAKEGKAAAAQTRRAVSDPASRQRWRDRLETLAWLRNRLQEAPFDE